MLYILAHIQLKVDSSFLGSVVIVLWDSNPMFYQPSYMQKTFIARFRFLESANFYTGIA